jgi:AraC-like DNA-binding protein
MGAREAREHAMGPWRLIDARFPAGERLERHTHDRVVLAVMLGGSFDLLIGGRRLPCLPGTVFTEPAGETHANAIGNRGAHVVVTQPDPANDFPRTCARLLDRVNHFDSPAIARLGRRMARELSRPDDLTPLECQALALEMLARAARLDDARARNGDPPAWLRRVEALIHDRFREPVRIDEVAHEAGVHPAHLIRVFRERYGTSPGQYLRRLRLEWAAEQLANGTESLNRVALQAGFADQAHFTRAFSRHWGLPPGRYRALRRG